MNRRIVFLLTLSLSSFVVVFAQKNTTADGLMFQKNQAIANLDRQYDYYKERAFQIWNFAEVGYKEIKSSSLLKKTLLDQGFSIDSGVAGIPTAFVATYGSGSPVIGILAEFDALPGLSQAAAPEKSSLGGIAGHARCSDALASGQ